MFGIVLIGSLLINKFIYVIFVMNELDDILEMVSKNIKTGCKKFDDFIGGGFSFGIITNIYGPSGAGKTILTMQAVKDCVLRDKKALYIDTEGGFSVDRFSQICERDYLKNVILKNVMDFEEQIKVIADLENTVEFDKVGVVIVDSIVALYRLERAGVDQNVQRANIELSMMFSKLSKIARKYNIPVIITNQVYTDFDSGNLEIVGGDIPKYASKCLIRLDRCSVYKRKAVLVKHRSKKEGSEMYFDINDKGIVDLNLDDVKIF
jgi:DNA repair protein RadB